MRYAVLAGFALLCAAASAQLPPAATPARTTASLFPGEEKFLANLKQLTFGGQNAEAYWSTDGKRLIFQSDEGRLPCDQIFTMAAAGAPLWRAPTAGDKPPGAFFFPPGERAFSASPSRAAPESPPRPDRSRGYVW